MSNVRFTHADLRFILGLIFIYLNNFVGAFIEALWVQPLSINTVSVGLPSASRSQSKLLSESINTDSYNFLS